MSALLTQVMQDSPAGLWCVRPESYSALRTDLSGNGRNISDAGGGTGPTTGAAIIPGGPGSLAWGSATNNMFIADAAWSSLTSAWTLEGWFRFSSVSSQQGLIEKYDAGGGYILRLSSTTGKLQMSPVNAGLSTDYLTSAATLVAGTTYHIAYTLSGSTAGILYINGVQDATKTHSVSAADGTARLDFGARSGDQTFRFSGSMSYLAVYSSALSAARIAAHYEAGLRLGVSY